MSLQRDYVEMPRVKSLSDVLDNCCSNFRFGEDETSDFRVVTLVSHCLDFQITYNRETKEIVKVEARDN